ncbi:fungal-specific transcription factor domain-containing protein [Aspergillus heterothallicus]
MSLHSFMRMNTELEIHPEAPSYIKRFFEVVHPVYPFIDRKTFEDRIALPKRDVLQTLNSDHQFCGLYYAVLALGAQYSGSGSFIPDNNGAWKFFQTALSCLDYILMSTDCIENLQAITAMAVFSTIAFGHSLDQTLVAEASRMVIALRYHKSALGEGQSLRHRIFWVIYHLEKRYCFQARQSSSIADYDIGCPISPSPDSLIGEYDWLLSSVRFSRILSIAYASLFSVTASTQSNSTLLASIDSVQTLLEEWRTSVPVEFRPKEPLQRQRVNDAAAKEIALRTHYYYYHIVIALSRLTLHVSHDVARSENAMRTLLDTARSVINLTRYIDVEPYTPTFILAILPLSALFILFDFVIHHPTDSDIHGYLTLLDIVAGHFSQLDYASNGAIPSSHLSEFSHMARGYVQRVKGNTVVGSGGGDTSDAEPDMGIREGMAGLSRGESAGPSTGAEASTTAPIPDPSLPTLPMRESNDQTLMEGIDYTSLDNLYFLTPDCDFWTAGRSFEEFDPREFYGEIFQ